jgi:SAM-dependent methyltransferase
MSGFSINWLDLREPADIVARNKRLTSQVVEFLMTDADISPVIVDLGSGTGSTLRALTSAGAHQCVWRLVDHDPALLNEALRRHGKHEIIEDYEADLLAVDALPLGAAKLLSASALFDLASADLIEQLVEKLTAQGTAFYAALNYDGRTQWSPAHPLDQAVLHAFNQDQRRDKGMGPALGPESSVSLQNALQRAGYHVQVADSAWDLGPEQHELVADLIRGIKAAVAEQYGLNKQDLDDWEQFRLLNTTEGHCIIGHLDVLAFPAKTSQ